MQGSGPPTSGGPPAAGDKPQPYIRTAALPPAAGDECRRCRVPALPRPVVGVSPAAGDEGRPGGGVAAGRLGMSAGGAGGGVAAGYLFSYDCLAISKLTTNVARRPVLRATDRGGLGRPLSGGQ